MGKAGAPRPPGSFVIGKLRDATGKGNRDSAQPRTGCAKSCENFYKSFPVLFPPAPLAMRARLAGGRVEGRVMEAGRPPEGASAASSSPLTNMADSNGDLL
jgi:hypothetical protein